MNLWKSGPTKIAFGFGLGILAADVMKEILPAFHGLGRPLLKAAVKSGLILGQRGRVRLEQFRETLADVRAEVQVEMEMEQAETHSDRSADPAARPAQAGR
jgi:Protein of unknown function (DUF5132)